MLNRGGFTCVIAPEGRPTSSPVLPALAAAVHGQRPVQTELRRPGLPARAHTQPLIPSLGLGGGGPGPGASRSPRHLPPRREGLGWGGGGSRLGGQDLDGRGRGGVSTRGLVPAGQGPCPQLRMLEDEAEKEAEKK